MQRKLWGGVFLIVLLVGVLVATGIWFSGHRDTEGRIELKCETSAGVGQEFTTLLRDKISRGQAFTKPADPALWGNPERDLSRFATTYYHRRSPVGIVLQEFDWFGKAEPGWQTHNRYPSDARLPASLIGLAAPILGQGTWPGDALAVAWSEPPIGVVFVNTGVLASYVRPFQHMHFYERGDEVAELSWPKAGQPRFVYVHDALARGAAVSRFPGDERKTLADRGPDAFYRVMIIETSRTDSNYPNSVLLTKEAMELYFRKVQEEGIVCFHTSARRHDLAAVVINVAHSLGLASRRGHDAAHDQKFPHFFTSEWVMVARKDAYLKNLREPPGYREQMRAVNRAFGNAPYWSTAPRTNLPVLTDDAIGSLSSYLRR